MKREQLSDDVTLYLGDCLEVMAEMEAGSVDSVITDPPYGIGEDGGACRTRSKPGISKHEKRNWDRSRPDKHVFDVMRTISTNQVIFGGNYFADLLPPTMGWIYWRKLMGGDFSDGELAWTSYNKALKEFTKSPHGMDKVHPTQKPLALMKWVIENYTDEGDTVFDPFMGSGTTGVAAVQLGRKFIGIEIDETYYEIAKKRISQAMLQMRLGI